jgi:hypothetical protein
MGANELIGQHVIATGSCGMKKGQEVFGILSESKGDWIVTVIDEDGWEMPCSVYYQTIKEA